MGHRTTRGGHFHGMEENRRVQFPRALPMGVRKIAGLAFEADRVGLNPTAPSNIRAVIGLVTSLEKIPKPFKFSLKDFVEQ